MQSIFTIEFCVWTPRENLIGVGNRKFKRLTQWFKDVPLKNILEKPNVI